MSGTTCPYVATDSIRVNFRKATPDEIIEHEVGCCNNFFSGLTTIRQRISNCWQFGRDKAFTPLIKAATEAEAKAGRPTYLVEMPMALPRANSSIPRLATFYVTSHPEVTKALLNKPRNGSKESSLYDTPDVLNSFYKIFRKIAGEEFTKPDNVLTCPSEHVRRYRDLFSEDLSQAAIETPTMKSYLVGLIQELMLDIALKQEDSHTVDVVKTMDIFASSVISKLLLGNEGPYQELTEAVDVILEDINNQLAKPKLSQEEKEKFTNAYQVLKDAIDVSLESNSEFIKEISSKLSPIQVKTTLALLYLAGQGSSSILMARCLFELGKRQDYQEKILNEINDNLEFRKFFEALDRGESPELPKDLDCLETVRCVFLEGMRLSTPAHMLARVTRSPLVLKVSQKSEEIFSKYIPAETMIIGLNNIPAHDPAIFERPDEFLPERFASADVSLNLPVFGGGVHICPGRFLVKKEIMLLIPFFVWHYRFESLKDTVQTKEELTLSHAEEIPVRFTPRQN